MQDACVNMQDKYVNMQDNYIVCYIILSEDKRLA